MTNTKFRRRALLSSVAMMLVALIALGSATFAWYAATVTVSATGMQFTTTAGAGLEIATKTGSMTFGKTATMTRDLDSLTPISVDQTGGSGGVPVFYTANGTDALNGAKSGDATDVTTYVNNWSNTTYAAQDYVFFKASAGAAVDTAKDSVYLTGVTVSLAGGEDNETAIAMASAVRVLVLGSDGKVLAEFAGADTAADTYISGATTTGTDKTLTPFGSCNIFTGITASAVAPTQDSDPHVTVLAYLDGFDSSIKSENAQTLNNAADILKSVTVTFTMKADPVAEP